MRRLGVLLALSLSSPALAHDLGDHASAIPGWTLTPGIVLPLLLAMAAFVTGWVRLRARSARGQEGLDRRARLFGGGWLILAGALLSPLHELGERSFAAHMAEHELIMLAAAPLLVLAEPLAIMLWALPGAARKSVGTLTGSPAATAAWSALSGAVAATLLQAAALWLWHAPALFDRALASPGWHTAQHGSFLIAALLFWTAMLGRRTALPVAVLCLIATSIVSGTLGALMAFATSPWYAGYQRLGMAPLGLTPAEDQQLAGLLMWVPGGLVHAGAALALMRQLLRPSHA